MNKQGETRNKFLYNGRDGVVTDNNGIYYMRARYYSPELKRFVNEDTVLGGIMNGQTLNRFAYVNGNPVSMVDPLGEYAQLITAGIGALLGAGSTYVGDVVTNYANGRSGLDAWKPTSSVGTYVGNTVGGAVAGAMFNPAGMLSVVGYAAGEAAISTGVQYGVDMSIDYADNGVMNGKYTFGGVGSNFIFNAAGNLGGAAVSKGVKKLMPNAKLISTPNRDKLKQSLRASGMRDGFGDAIRAKRVGYEQMNDALAFGPFDKFTGTFIGNILTNAFSSEACSYK